MLTLVMLTSTILCDPSGVCELPEAVAAREHTYAASAEVNTKRRAVPKVDHRSEDLILGPSSRSKLVASARDINRNFAIAAWAVRRHLDYVSTFQFHARSKDSGLNTDIEELLTEWQKRKNCDAARRHRFPKLIRLAECRRTLDGDVGVLKLRDGRLQGIEGDRIRDPRGDQVAALGEWTHGVRTDAGGAALQYAIHKRTANAGFALDRIVTEANLELLGYFDRFDAVRGVSPIAAGLNSLQDVYENFDLALAKAKVTQLFALAFYRDAAESVGSIDDEETTATDDDGNETTTTRYKVDFGRGPAMLDLDPGDRAEFLESHHPSSEFQAFTTSVVMVALKAIDIPFSFFDESHTNFFGSRGAWMHYERSCRDKRDDLIELLDEITRWRLQLAILNGDLILPRTTSIDDLWWEWVPAGMPWWDQAKEVRGDLMAIGAGMDTPQRVTKEHGRGDWYDNVDEIAKAIEYAKGKGFTLSFDPGDAPVEVVNGQA